jgi:hypothetical protein
MDSQVHSISVDSENSLAFKILQIALLIERRRSPSSDKQPY